MTKTTTANSSQSNPPADQAGPPVFTIDGVAYAFEALNERARLLSIDYINTDQEWQQLQHRLRQFLALETTMVNSLKQEVEQSAMEPVWTSGEPRNSDQPLLTIDSKSYDATTIPDAVRLHVDDLLRNNQERSQLEFRLRQLDAARLGYLTVIREELSSGGATPLDPQPPTDGAAGDD